MAGSELLFEGNYEDCCLRGGFARTFDVGPDGRRFLMVEVERTLTEMPRIEVVQGWLQDVVERVGGR